MTNTPDDILGRFDRSGGPDACHPWTRYTDPAGYGRVSYQGTLEYTHHLVFQWAGGGWVARRAHLS